MASVTRRIKLGTYAGLAPDVWESAGFKLGDWIEVSTSQPGQVAVRLAEAASDQDRADRSTFDLTPYTLDEALALFPITGATDDAHDAESLLEQALRDSLRGSSLV